VTPRPDPLSLGEGDLPESGLTSTNWLTAQTPKGTLEDKAVGVWAGRPSKRQASSSPSGAPLSKAPSMAHSTSSASLSVGGLPSGAPTESSSSSTSSSADLQMQQFMNMIAADRAADREAQTANTKALLASVQDLHTRVTQNEQLTRVMPVPGNNQYASPQYNTNAPPAPYPGQTFWPPPHSYPYSGGRDPQDFVPAEYSPQSFPGYAPPPRGPPQSWAPPAGYQPSRPPLHNHNQYG
jgi:hypothetical protein